MGSAGHDGRRPYLAAQTNTIPPSIMMIWPVM